MPIQLSLLAGMLDEACIGWHDDSEVFPWTSIQRPQEPNAIWRVISNDTDTPFVRREFSAICGVGTYGGDDGLIELWRRCDAEPVGYLTASEAFEMIQEQRTEA